MRIGIVGAGDMCRALGSGWAAAGHEILVGARDRDAADAAAMAIGHGTHGGTIAEAIAFGEAVLLAIPPQAWSDVHRAAADAFTGRTLIDCTNAFAPDAAAPQGATGFVLAEEAVAERIAVDVPDAHVVKAFNLCAAELWGSDTREFDGRRLAVPICGDNADAVRLVSGLAEDLKLTPMAAGGLRHARYLEATSAFVVGLWFAGHDARDTFPPLAAAFAVRD